MSGSYYRTFQEPSTPAQRQVEREPATQPNAPRAGLCAECHHPTYTHHRAGQHYECGEPDCGCCVSRLVDEAGWSVVRLPARDERDDMTSLGLEPRGEGR